MSGNESLPLVMVAGASGLTGRSVVEGLLRTNKFRVAALARSGSKPILVDFKSRGVIIRELDHSTASLDQLKEALEGVDVLISTTGGSAILAQKPLFSAAKAVGVKRVIPDDFATSAPVGVMYLHDQKLTIRDYLREIQQPATFVEVGYWKQLILPFPANQASNPLASLSYTVYGTGDVPTAGTDLDHIGDHVARIIQDERTINQTVFVWEEEITKNEIWKIAERKCGDWPALEKKRVNVPAEALRSLLDDAIANENLVMRFVYEYAWSQYIRGDNTVEKAKSRGALDFKQLYPDVVAQSFEEFADKFYQNPPILY